MEKISLHFRIDIFKAVSLPLDLGVANSILPIPKNQQNGKDIMFCYKAIVGWLIYAMMITCSDLGYVFSIISQYCINFDSTHVMEVI